MKKILFAILILLPLAAFSQKNQYKATGISYTKTTPNWTPARGTEGEIAIDSLTGKWYQYSYQSSAWVHLGYFITETGTYGVPSYTPNKVKSVMAINSGDSLYHYRDGSWYLAAGGGGGGGDGIYGGSDTIPAGTTSFAPDGFDMDNLGVGVLRLGDIQDIGNPGNSWVLSISPFSGVKIGNIGPGGSDNHKLTIDNFSTTLMQGSNNYLTLNGTTNTLRLSTNKLNISTSNGAFQGLVYASDPSANFVPLSLVTKDYVDGLAFGGGGGGHVLANAGVAVAQKDTADFLDTGDIDFTVANTATTTTIVADVRANVIDSLNVATGALSVTDLGQHGASSGNILKWNGTQWAPATDNAATVGNLTAASSKVTVTGGTGAVIGAGATVDVNESNLTMDDIPINQIAFGNSGSTGITSDADIMVNTALSGGTINKTYGIKVKAGANSGVVVDSLTSAGYGFGVAASENTTNDIIAAYFNREGINVAGDIKILLRNRLATAGADSQLDLISDGSGGDTRITMSTGTSTVAIIGRDNNDSDALKITNSLANSTTDLTTSYAIVVNTSDEVGIKGSAVASRALTVTGNMRLTSVTGTPTSILGRDGSNDIGTVTLGTGLTLTAGAITPALDLAGLEGLSTNGIAVRTATSTWTTRTITGPAAGITVSNGDGVSGNPTLALANDLSALEALSGTGLVARTASETYAERTITAGTGISVSNGNGVSGNPTVSADTSLLATVNDLNISATQIAFGSASGSITGSNTLAYETNTISMYPSANDTLLAVHGTGSIVFGVRSFTDPYNGAVNAYDFGGLTDDSRVFLRGFGFYPKAPFYQEQTAGIGFRGTTGSLNLHTNGDYYTATITGDNQTTNRNVSFYFESGGATTGYGNPVVFQNIFSNNDSTANGYEFISRNTASGGVTIADSALFRITSWDRGIGFNLTQAGDLGLKLRQPLYSLDINDTDGIRVPRGTTAQRPAGTPAGVVRFNTDSTALEVGTGSGWTTLGSSGGGGVSDGDKGDITVSSSGTVWTIDADVVDSTNISTGGVSVTDIGQHGASSGQVLKWNGTQWAPDTDNTVGGTIYYQTLRDDGVDKTQRGKINFTAGSIISTTLSDDGANDETEVLMGIVSNSISNTEIGTNAVGSDELADNGVADGDIRQSAGLSVIGRSANSTGNVADITAGTDNNVLRRSGTSIGWGAINLASSNAVTGLLPVANLAADAVVNGGNTLAAALTIGTNDANALNFEVNNVKGLTMGTTYELTATASVSNTNTTNDRIIIKTNSTGTATTSFGSGILFQGESSTNDDQDMARISTAWNTATHASREAKISFFLGDNGGALQEAFKFDRVNGSQGALYIGASSAVVITNNSFSANANYTFGNGGFSATLNSSLSSSVTAVLFNASGNSTSASGTIGNTTFTTTSGTKYDWRFSSGYTVSSGTGGFFNVLVNPTISQTTSTGATGFMDISPTLTNIAGGYDVFRCATSNSGMKFLNQTGVSTTNVLVGKTAFGSTTAPTDAVDITGNLNLTTAGNKIKIATGSNASAGVSGAMTAGSITISTTAVTANSLIFLTHATLGGTQGILSVGTITAGTSFVINSSSASDTGTVNWLIIN
jgi:hypothetical protein